MTEERGPGGGRSRLEGRHVLAAARRVTMSSTLADLREEWAGLDEETRSWFEKWLFRTPIALGIVSLLLLAAMMSNLGGTVVHLVARTEYVRYTPLGNDPPQWLLENATITSVASMDGLAVSAFFPLEADEGTLPESAPEDPSEENPPEVTSLESASEDPSDERRSKDHPSGCVSGSEGEAATRSESISRCLVVADDFSGFFQPHCGDTIVVSRIGKGPLRIRISSDLDPIITDIAGETSTFSSAELGRTFTFTIPAPDDGSAGPGSSLVWPLEGRVDPGRAVGAQTTSEFGLLLEGKVEIVAGRVGSDSTYTVDGHTLELGDQVRLPTSYDLDGLIAKIDEEQAGLDEQRRAQALSNGAAPSGDDRVVPTLCRAFDVSNAAGTTDKGFIHPDDGKGVNVSLSSNARYADIVRYRTEPIRVRSGWFKRLGNDPVISFGWAVIGAIFVFHRKIVRLAVIVAGEMNRKRKGTESE